jgi:hypothetical protein
MNLCSTVLPEGTGALAARRNQAQNVPECTFMDDHVSLIIHDE